MRDCTGDCHPENRTAADGGRVLGTEGCAVRQLEMKRRQGSADELSSPRYVVGVQGEFVQEIAQHRTAPCFKIFEIELLPGSGIGVAGAESISAQSGHLLPGHWWDFR